MLKLSAVLTEWAPGDKSAAHEPIALLEASWAEIVGPEVARNSHPLRIADATLHVVTRSSAWSHQLNFLGEHILRAVTARLPRAGVERLRFRVGALPRAGAAPRAMRRPREVVPPADRPEPASALEAFARFRDDVEERQRARRSAGWKECRDCGALISPEERGLCVTCGAAQTQERAAAAARLLFEAPWLGYAGTAALVAGLEEEEYERIRTQLLSRWWGLLVRARAAKRLSRNGRERLVASSYVVLRSKLPPEEIMPATVRSVLGDELHELLYGEAQGEAVCD